MPKYTHRTRSGLPARIVCTDMAGSLPVLALVLESCYEHTVMLSESLSFTDDGETHDLDLFEVKPWEFERPSAHARRVGQTFAPYLYDASVRSSSMGCLRGGPKLDLNACPEELRDLIQAYVNDELDAVEATYIAMRRAEAQHAGQ